MKRPRKNTSHELPHPPDMVYAARAAGMVAVGGSSGDGTVTTAAPPRASSSTGSDQ